MIYLGRVCKEIIDKNFRNEKDCIAILDEVLNIDTPVNMVCNRVNFGKTKTDDGTVICDRAVCECKVRKTYTKITIVRETDGKLYLRHMDGDTVEIVNNRIDNIDVYRYYEVEADIIHQDMRDLLKEIRQDKSR